MSAASSSRSTCDPARLASRLSELRGLVEQSLCDYLDRLSEDCPAHLLDAMRYSLLAPGKRMRPALVLLACEACGGSREAALPAAAAIEMIHTYSLIHDDLPAMDDDDLRRGRPTCHKQFDEATAILAGDALLTLAFETIATKVSPAQVAVACCVDLASAAGPEGMVGGQMADLDGERNGVGSGEHLEAIHRRKTGRLLCSAVTLGGRIAGADAATLGRLRRYGECVGLAFQIADDLLDVEGEGEKLGKSVRKDAEHGKLTYPSLWGIAESRRRAEALVQEACGLVDSLDDAGEALAAIARYVITRDH
ncbi:MAG: polyprenyl synthetase family protein [Planctomycetaceae bacterium]